MHPKREDRVVPYTKGTDVVSLKKLFREMGRDQEKRFLERLSPEMQELYHSIVHTSWTPISKQTEIYEAAALMLFPGHPQYLMELGKCMSRRSYSTVYKIFLRIPTMEFVVNRAASLWRFYHDQGDALIIDFKENSATFVVRNYPDLSRKMREIIAGHIAVLLELTGGKNIYIDVLDTNPEAWKWELSWTR
jgi:hypothetical protein